MKNQTKFDFFCSWSGGKDSCLALYRMMEQGHRCKSLLTIIDETGIHSRSHRLKTELLKKQADSLGFGINFSHTNWDNYETTFKKAIKKFKEQEIDNGVFGDIDLEEHKVWVDRVCQSEGISSYEPLWKTDRKLLVYEFINAGFKAKIIVVNTKLIPEKFLGRIIDKELVQELESIGADACGENGEYHTFVFDGPIFRKPISLSNESIERHEEYSFLPITINQ